MAVLLLLPVLEILVIIEVGTVIGAWPTVGLLVVISVIGAWLMRREGRRAWQALREAAELGRLPDRELADTPFVMLGGVLLLIPGFITDLFGVLLILPFTRPLARRLGHGYAARRARRFDGSRGGVRVHPGTVIREDAGDTGDEPPVIRGVIVNDDPDGTSGERRG